MDRDAALARVRAIECEHARLHAEQAELLVLIAGSSPVVEELLVCDPRPGCDEERTIRIADAVREEIAAFLGWSPAQSHARIDEARLLAGPLGATAAHLRDGLISPRHVAVIAEAARRLPGRLSTAPGDAEGFAGACDRLQERVLPVARRATVSRTRAAAKRAVLVIDASGEARRRRVARCTRDVWVTDDDDGLSTLVARLATERAHAILSAVTQAATRPPSDPGASDLRGPGPGPAAAAPTAGERRADALAELVLRGSGTAAPGAELDVRLDLVVPLDVLLGVSDGPVELRGAGALSAEVLRDLLADPAVAVSLRRLVVDPVTGHLLDVGRHSYAIPARLRELVVTRDGTCRFPGCSRAASACQLDHAQAWDDGGGTSVGNLGALCTRHHQLKTHAGWALTAGRPDGSCTWHSPAGRRYDHHPPPF